MAEKTKKLADRVREVMDALVDVLEDLLHPPPVAIPVRVKQPRLPTKRRR